MNDSRMVVVVGAGIAGLETAIALNAIARENVRVKLIAPEQEFSYRPLVVAEPFGIGRVLRAPLEQLVHAAGAHIRRGALTGVDITRRRVILDERDECALRLARPHGRRAPGSVIWVWSSRRMGVGSRR